MELTDLARIDISGNTFDDLPNELSQFSSTLQGLDCSNNKLRMVPSVIPQLTSLLELNLAANGISQLPNEFRALDKLLRIDLRNNSFTQFPRVLTRITCLEHIFLAYNQLKEIPEIHSLQNIQTFDIGNNKVREMAEGLRFLPKLSFLNLENNEFGRLPQELGVCEQIKTLLVGGNPQRQIKHTVVQQGTNHIVAALRTQLPADSPYFGTANNAAATQTTEEEDQGGARRKLEGEIVQLTKELEDYTLSSAKKYAVKKQLARAKADLIREKRKAAAK